MIKQILISTLVDHLEMASDGLIEFYNRESIDIITIFEDFVTAVELENLLVAIESSKYFVKLPTQHDIHELRIMKNFAIHQEEKIKHALLVALSKKSPYRRFKDEIKRKNVESQYYQWRSIAFKKIAIEWCEKNQIQYID